MYNVEQTEDKSSAVCFLYFLRLSSVQAEFRSVCRDYGKDGRGTSLANRLAMCDVITRLACLSSPQRLDGQRGVRVWCLQ